MCRGIEALSCGSHMGRPAASGAGSAWGWHTVAADANAVSERPDHVACRAQRGRRRENDVLAGRRRVTRALDDDASRLCTLVYVAALTADGTQTDTTRSPTRCVPGFGGRESHITPRVVSRCGEIR